MPVEACGCVWEDGIGVGFCPPHRAHAAKAERIAWRIAARDGLPFDEAWVRLWDRAFAWSIAPFLREAGR